MIKTVIMGTGRMGSLIRTTAEGVVDAAGQPVFNIVAQIGFDLSELENAPAADVIIDFSNVVTFDAVVAYVERTGAALVSGTTGYTPEQMDRLRELGQNARVMHSGNYSIGIAALRHLVAQATRELPGFDCEIVETHHNQKVDAPSGTAKLLLDAVVEAEPEAGYHPVYGREGMCGARDPKEIGISSTCTVFAESEVISQLAVGTDKCDIIAGIHRSVAGRVSGLCNRVGVRDRVVMTGGVAQNHGIVKALENQLGHEISTSPLTQYNGALGAALFAYQKALKKQP